MIKDLVAQLSNVSGSGNITLDGEVDGRLTFLDAGYAYGDTVRYVVQEPDGTNFGKFEGVLTSGSPDFLTRGTFLGSMTGEPVDFSTTPGKLVYVDASASLLAADGGRLNFSVTAGTATAYTALPPVPVEQFKNGVTVWVRIHADNTSADVTFAPSALDPKPIKAGTPRRKPAIGALKTGALVCLVADETNACWVAVAGLVNTTKTVAANTYTFLEEDHGQHLIFTSSVAISATIAEATGQFAAPLEINYEVRGVGIFTVTPATSTINGASSYQAGQGAAGQIRAEDGNYRASGAVPMFSANKGGVDQTGIASATFTKLTFTSEELDIGGYYDAANSKYTPPAGKYLFTANIIASAGLVDQSACFIALYKNGANYKSGTSLRASGGSTAYLGPALSVIADANGTDYFELYFYSDGAGSKSVQGVSSNAYFQAVKVA